jgi:hypothetical protein
MTNTNINAEIKIDVNRLIEYLGAVIKKGIDKAEKKQVEKTQRQAIADAIFKDTAIEMNNNLAILGEIKDDDIKTLAINSAPIKTIVKSLETTYQEQCETYINKNTKLKKKKAKAKIIDKIALAQFKINQMRRLTQKTKKELEASTHQYRPAVRLKNIHKVYADIRKILKQH